MSAKSMTGISMMAARTHDVIADILRCFVDPLFYDPVPASNSVRSILSEANVNWLRPNNDVDGKLEKTG